MLSLQRSLKSFWFTLLLSESTMVTIKPFFCTNSIISITIKSNSSAVSLETGRRWTISSNFPKFDFTMNAMIVEAISSLLSAYPDKEFPIIAISSKPSHVGLNQAYLCIPLTSLHEFRRSREIRSFPKC